MAARTHLLCICTAGLLARAGAIQPQQVPVRAIRGFVSSDSITLRNVAGVRQLPDGRVLVNDPSSRRLLAFDSTLAAYNVVLDTAGGAGPNKYGAQPGGLIPFTGDSSLFIDRDAQVFVVLDAAGRPSRTIAPPQLGDLPFFTNPVYGIPGVDKVGRVIYRANRKPAPRSPQGDRDGANTFHMHSLPDSAPILRVDFDRRAVDTIAMFRIPITKFVSISTAPGRTDETTAFNPLPTTDAWAVLSDGTVAIVRGYDYHIDWLSSSGTMTSSPKMPFDWRRISLEEKQRLLDSVRTAYETQRRKAALTNPGFDAARNPPTRFMTVDVSDLPDYYPSLRQGQVKSDRDGNVWILPATSTLAKGGLLFDVANRQGKVFERVQLPAGRNLAGFGPGGVVYMSTAAGPGHVRLERGRISQ